MLRCCGGSNYEGRRTGYFSIGMSGDSTGNGRNESNQHRKEKAQVLTVGGSAVEFVNMAESLLMVQARESVPPEEDITGSQAAALKPVTALKKDSTFTGKIK